MVGGGGWGFGAARREPEEAQGCRAPRCPRRSTHPSSPHPGSRRHATPGRGRRVLAGTGGVRGRGALCWPPSCPAGRPESSRAAQVQRAPGQELRPQARPAGQNEREAQRGALGAPGSRLGLKPYHPERALSPLIWETEQGRACLVLGWETA